MGYLSKASYITELLNQVEVINEIVEDEEDLIEDFISIITSYCARIYGKRIIKGI